MNAHAAAPTSAYEKKHPGMVIASAETNIMLTNEHVSRFTTMLHARLAPCERRRCGMISALYVLASGPNPMEKAAKKARADKTLPPMLAADATTTQSVMPSDTMDTATPAVLAWRSSCRLRRSEKRVATRMKHILMMLTPTVAGTTALLKCTMTTQMRIQRTLARCLRHYH